MNRRERLARATLNALEFAQPFLFVGWLIWLGACLMYVAYHVEVKVRWVESPPAATARP